MEENPTQPIGQEEHNKMDSNIDSRFSSITIIWIGIVILVILIFLIHSFFNNRIISVDESIENQSTIIAPAGELVEGFPKKLILFTDGKIVSSKKTLNQNGTVDYITIQSFDYQLPISQVTYNYNKLFADAKFAIVSYDYQNNGTAQTISYSGVGAIAELTIKSGNNSEITLRYQAQESSNVR